MGPHPVTIVRGLLIVEEMPLFEGKELIQKPHQSNVLYLSTVLYLNSQYWYRYQIS